MIPKFITWVLLWTALVASGQTVDFSNKGKIDGVDAPIFDDQGIRLAGPRYVAQLYAWNQWNRFLPASIPAPFTTNGYFLESTVRIPFIIGGSAWVQVRAWNLDGGATFEQAATAGGWTGVSSPLFLPGTGHGGVPPATPARLIGLRYPGPPIIVTPPQSGSILNRQPTRLSVVASSGVRMNYQWYQRPSERPDGLIPGATNTSYATPNLDNTTVYWVTVTNSLGSVTSETATMTVVPSGPKVTLKLEFGLPVLTVDGQDGPIYLLQTSTNLGTGNWVLMSLVENHSSFGDNSQTTNRGPRFYRVAIP